MCFNTIIKSNSKQVTKRKEVSFLATMKDVAREAGVSVATVSYYVNNKSISEKNAKKVREAIEKLDYFVHTTAQSLRRADQKVVGVVFPNISEPYYEKIINSVKNSLLQRGVDFLLELSEGDPGREQRAVMDFVSKRLSGIILYSCQPENSSFFRMLSSSKIPFVLIDRKNESIDANYIDCNNESLFYDAARTLISAGRKDIAFIGGHTVHTENAAAYKGFCAAQKEPPAKRPDCRDYFTEPTRENGFRACMKLIEEAAELPSAILTTSVKMAEGIRYALVFNRIEVPREIVIVAAGDCEDDIFFMDTSILKLSRPAFGIGEAAVGLLLQNIHSPIVFEKQQLKMKGYYDMAALDIPAPPATIGANIHSLGTDEEITVLLIDDYGSISALQQLLIDFTAKERIRVNIEKVLPELEYDYISAHIEEVDALLFDVPWLPHLVQENLLLCLDDFIDKYRINPGKFAGDALLRCGAAGGHTYALPFLVSTQLLFYRKDLFLNETLQKEYESRYMIPLELPKNWLQYNAISEFFTQTVTPSSPVRYGSTLSVSYTEQLMCSFFPRLWAYGGSLFDADGVPSFASSAAKKAVQNLLATVKTAHPDCITDRPEHVIDKLLRGETAMCCEFFNYVTNLFHKYDPSVTSRIGYTNIPGGRGVMGGWSFGISAKSQKAESAFKFMKWITSSAVAIPHTILGGQSPHLKAYHNYDVVSLYPWLPTALNAFSHSRKRELPAEGPYARFSEQELERIMAEALFPLVRQTLAGHMPGMQEIERALSLAEQTLVQGA